MIQDQDTRAAEAPSKWLDGEHGHAALRLSLVFWLCMFAVDSLLGLTVKIDPLASAGFKLLGYGVALLLVLGMAAVHLRLRHISFLAKALLSFVMTTIAAPTLTAADFLLYKLCEYPDPVAFDPQYSGFVLVVSFSQFFGWSCLFTALLYSFDVSERERHLAIAREEAISAQVQALRYQINPHFLFNTLNSIAGLIEEGAAAQSGRMVMSLSNFLRTTLSIDPEQDVRLDRELELQDQYLSIERTRFSDRMAFNITVDRDARDALVPCLILQPLIENAVKHGVGPATGPVTIDLHATREDDRLHITIENDVPHGNISSRQPGMGLGLRNVAARLRTRFADGGQVASGLTEAGRYRAQVALPWKLA